MSKTRIEETNNEENLLNDLIVSSNDLIDGLVEPPIVKKKAVKAKIELSDRDKKIIDWYKRGQSIDWITKAFQVSADKAKEIIDNANV